MYNKIKLIFFCSTILFLTIIVNAQNNSISIYLTHSWTFNDGTAEDHIGNADGTLMGNAYISNGSLWTDYYDSWMEMPGNIIMLREYEQTTIEAWFKSLANANTGFHMLAYFGDTYSSVGNNYYFFTPAREDNISRAAISCGFESSPWQGESGANGPELDDGELHHFVSTLNHEEITLYIDGQLVESTPLSSNNSISKISPAYVYLAKSGYEFDPKWMGEILEFNIYNKALNTDEVLFLYQKGATTDLVNSIDNTPSSFSLFQNYPNPFNPITKIQYSIPQNGFVTIKVYDIMGKEISTLIEENHYPGIYTVTFDGSKLSSGIYFYKMTCGNYNEVKKLTLVK